MPATTKGNNAPKYVLGVDGCRAGWVAVRRSIDGDSTGAAIWPDFATLMREAATNAAMTIVDMPIGLADKERRTCEKLARQLLKPKRTPSVFSSPLRPMLNFATWEEANCWGKNLGPGMGLQKQAWAITPKIREIDDAITPQDQMRLGEGHPEIAFWRLNGGAPCDHPKRKPEGAKERRNLLARNGFANAEELFVKLKEIVGRGVARDDVYDACALALTAEARLIGMAQHLTDGSRDARGLLMEIWG